MLQDWIKLNKDLGKFEKYSLLGTRLKGISYERVKWTIHKCKNIYGQL